MHRFLNVAGKESSGKYSARFHMFACRRSKIWVDVFITYVYVNEKLENEDVLKRQRELK